MEKGQYRIFAYQAVCDDWYGRNNARIMLPRSLTDKRALIQHKDAGFNTLFVSYAFQYNAMEEDFNKTDLKKVMDLAHELDLKCIIFEKNLHRITGRMHSLIDTKNANGQTTFASEEELVEFVRKCLEEPMKHPAFIGVSTMDEPRGEMLLAYGQAVKAIKQVMPDIYINANICLGYHNYLGAGQDLELSELGKYKANLEVYNEKVNPAFIQFGMYPVKHIYNRESKELLNGKEYAKNHLAACCLAAEVCDKLGKPMSVIMQSSEWTVPTAGWGGAKVTENDIYLQANVLMAVGTSIYSYWTYYPPINSAGEYYDDKATIVDTFGRPNELYYVVKELHQKMQRVAPILTEFKYKGVKLFCGENLYKYCDNILSLEQAILDKEISTFDDKISVETGNTSSVMVTKLYNPNTDESGYYLINVTDPQYNDVAEVKVTIVGVEKLKVYFEGEESTVTAQDGKFFFKLNAGRGVFVVPVK